MGIRLAGFVAPSSALPLPPPGGTTRSQSRVASSSLIYTLASIRLADITAKSRIYLVRCQQCLDWVRLSSQAARSSAAGSGRRFTMRLRAGLAGALAGGASAANVGRCACARMLAVARRWAPIACAGLRGRRPEIASNGWSRAAFNRPSKRPSRFQLVEKFESALITRLCPTSQKRRSDM